MGVKQLSIVTGAVDAKKICLQASQYVDEVLESEHVAELYTPEPGTGRARTSVRVSFASACAGALTFNFEVG